MYFLYIHSDFNFANSWGIIVFYEVMKMAAFVRLRKRANIADRRFANRKRFKRTNATELRSYPFITPTSMTSMTLL